MSEAPKKRWYVVQAFSGLKAAASHIAAPSISVHNMERLFGMVPTEEEVVAKDRGGQRRKSERKFFRVTFWSDVMNDASWLWCVACRV